MSDSMNKLLASIKGGVLKDEILNLLRSHNFNIAQFVSFSAETLEQRFSKVGTLKANHKFASVEEAVSSLVENSLEKRINIRTFKTNVLKGNPFKRGLTDIKQISDQIRHFAQEGYYIILNESIDIFDGGVSGVAMGNVIEFSPNDTPKSVDKIGICSLRRKFGLDLLYTIYGFKPKLDFDFNYRVEFSIHPKRRGVLNEHTIIWEIEEAFENKSKGQIQWPNNFSKFIGDKVFGLLIAEYLGAKVPYTTVICRNVAPFSFGKPTGLSENWIRTSPNEKTPGFFPTKFGWEDPFKLMQDSDPDCLVNSLLSQKSVNPIYSGAMIVIENGVLIEGVKGNGSEFMIGERKPEPIPNKIQTEIKKVVDLIRKKLENFSFEWVYDGNEVWIVQLNLLKSRSTSNMIYPGKVNSFIEFPVEKGLEELRNLVSTWNRSDNFGIELKGNVGITSHFGDILRNAKIPSKLTPNVELADMVR
jgi:hypothetical protein